ncbi:unnamed protein product [Clonostachys byssicola]|uniref:P-loop containing nucleoside triphosphate hydrolase protein n=1 Tax=Clonostachys byssicola TaxID=160290 RepID=A0A9N9Y4I0_9HYPO|nr:unnamed protein product [Clonostachys byssicola]
MGQQYSHPQPGKKLQVIGAGLPRTGTTSFGRALEILLDGPVYHGGTQVTLGPEVEIKSWIKVLSCYPPKSEAEHRQNLELIRQRTDGFSAITDSPGCSMVAELMTLYPDAKVVCTTRDVDSWVKSMAVVASASTKWFLRIVLLPVPSMRHFNDYIEGLREQWINIYGEAEPATAQIYQRHYNWLKDNVPADRLVMLDVKDGWEPLCRALELPIPEGIEFPRINDSKAIEEFSKQQIMRGLKRWCLILSTLGAVGFALLRR